MKYDPTNALHRTLLGDHLVFALQAAGFTDASVDEKTQELVLERPIEGSNARIEIFTSLVDGEARVVGIDAIRVLAVARMDDGRTLPVARTTRVHRTGTIKAIIERTLERAREAYRTGRSGLTPCRTCGFSRFVSRKGNVVCGAACWKDKAA